jgi:hypothetical protein
MWPLSKTPIRIEVIKYSILTAWRTIRFCKLTGSSKKETHQQLEKANDTRMLFPGKDYLERAGPANPSATLAETFRWPAPAERKKEMNVENRGGKEVLGGRSN